MSDKSIPAEHATTNADGQKVDRRAEHSAPKAEKRSQVSATLSPAELAAFRRVRFEGEHDKQSDVVYLALKAYCAEHGHPFPA